MTERPKVRRVGLSAELVVDLSTLKPGVVYDLIAEAQEMTPEERADAIAERIAQAIREAVAEEREACAKLADKLSNSPSDHEAGAALAIAAAIRARATPEKQ